MSVILTDMEMPSGCWCCEFGAAWDNESSMCKRKPMESPVGNSEKRPLWCPLKEQEAVVRCKDCINCVKEPNGELYCDILAVGYEPLGSKKVTEDWYCADGERKEGW